MHTCTVDELTRFATDVLVAIGMPEAPARDMAGIIVGTDAAGHESHGMRRLPEYVARWRAGKADPAAQPRIDLDTGSVLRVDGCHAFGHVTFRYVTGLAVERARRHGACAVAVRRTDHAGRLADFCEQAAGAGVVILFFVNDAGAGQVVAPHGGDAARLATNPIGVGVPRATSPHLVLDMSTSVVAAGRLAEERDRGTPFPPEWVTASGALRTLGGAKGFWLAVGPRPCPAPSAGPAPCAPTRTRTTRALSRSPSTSRGSGRWPTSPPRWSGSPATCVTCRSSQARPPFACRERRAPRRPPSAGHPASRFSTTPGHTWSGSRRSSPSPPPARR